MVTARRLVAQHSVGEMLAAKTQVLVVWSVGHKKQRLPPVGTAAA